MSDDHAMTESNIIREAEALSELTISEIRTHADDSDLSAALNVLIGDGLADDETGSVDTDGENVVRIDRFLLVTDSDGFRSVTTYDYERLAISAMDETRRMHSER